MTNNENWVKNNSEVETEEKENGAVVLTGAAEEQIVEDENTSDDVVEVVDETSEETEDEVADDASLRKRFKHIFRILVFSRLIKVVRPHVAKNIGIEKNLL